MELNLNILTQRELNILTEILKGKTNEEISETFSITSHTVKAHIKSILHKTQLKHRCQLISCILSNLSTVDIYSPDFQGTLHSLQFIQK